MTDQETIDELKAQAAKDPFELREDGTAIKMPNALLVRMLTIKGLLLSVGFTYDLCPSTGLRIEHLSMSGINRHPVPDDIQNAVIRLAFGPEVALVQKLNGPLGRAHQWILIRRDKPK